MSDEALWYLNRSTGIVLLVLMTGAIVLGVVVRRRGRLPGLPRFGVVGLHRSLALLSALLLLAHVVSAAVDSYVDIALVDAVVPFTSGYRPVAVGLGALALDLVVLVVATSLLRGRLPLELWRWVHRFSWVMWPLALAHGVTAGTDLASGFGLGLVLACAAATAAAAVASYLDRRSLPPSGVRAAAALDDASTALGARRPLAIHRNG
jgi:methionine sulfoxide reductase heme-binding subunit